jgi:Family of unknown function (DUF5330)
MGQQAPWKASVMRFLLRLAFWFAVIAVLLPESGSRPPSRTQLGAGDAISAARATVDDMRQFCERQAEACTVGSQAAQVLGDRAKAGAKQIYELLNDKTALSESDAVTTASTARGPTAIPLPPPRPSQHTLTPSDLVPSWQGLVPRKDARTP